MKVIIPLARMKNEEPGVQGSFPNIEVAGKPIIIHLVEQIMPLKPEEIIFIVGQEAEKTINITKKEIKTKLRYIKQKQLKGSAHAIYGAKKYFKEKEEILILFGDTFFKANIKSLNKEKAEGIIWVKEVEDPSRLGIVIKKEDEVTKLIEKPDEPISNLAMIGLYYFKNAKKVFESISYILSNNIRTKNAFHLTDAIQLMINKGDKIIIREVEEWVDCDEQAGINNTLKYLLRKNNVNKGKTENSIIIKPAYIEKGAIIKNSIIGPNVSISEGAIIEDSMIRESIIGNKAKIRKAMIRESIIGNKAKIKGEFKKIKLKDETIFSE